jgi:integrase
LGNNGKSVATSKGRRYQVRWKLHCDGIRNLKECKRTDFVTKASAQYFMEELDKAHHGVTDTGGRLWRFDAQGRPTNLRETDETVLGALDVYVLSRWHTDWQEAQRTKVRGRFLRVVVQLTTCTERQRQDIFEALDAQRTDRGQRPEPTTRAQWVARWLRDYAFYPDKDEDLSVELADAKAWLESVSMPLCALSVKHVTDLRLLIVGKGDGVLAPSTRRAYWSGAVVPFLDWLYEIGLVERHPLRGQKKMKRDIRGEKPDPTKILTPAHVAAQSAWFQRHYGDEWALFPLIGTYCALRIGEALQIRLCDFFLRSGRWYLRLDLQIHRVTKACSNDGKGKKIGQPKSQLGTRPKTREIPLPAKVAVRLVDLFGDRLGTDTTHLFRGPRGAVGNTSGAREWWERSLAEVVVPTAPRLARLTPHAIRHAGMTYWFAQKCDEKRIQQWGGWESLVVMQDTYRGVLDSMEEMDLAGMDRFDETWSFEDEADPFEDDDNSSVGAKVVDLALWRQRCSSV